MSAVDWKTPACRPARYAAPNAVVSVTTGRSTGRSRMSARNCMTQSFLTMPPSTRSAVSFVPLSFSIAAMRSRVW
ncbi:hypothetical protein D3C83_137370 [compost metagenome]